MANEQTFALCQTKHVWIEVYCKASMYDLAWELSNYEAFQTNSQIYEIVRVKRVVGQLGNSGGTD
jgi:hypothetical protein